MLNYILNFFKNKYRVKSFLQIFPMEATECGAASLSMIFAHYGLWLPLEICRNFEGGVEVTAQRLIFILKEARHRG